ncbi:GNAT family N-acetyltransferase [Cyanobium sp. ATX 6A2]|uniref:GNAT family N-acetyltransferase n=1 Tax=Cyanobium sp. ATX 6A2 TaxID=2823700 RepID=UPI0020CB8ADD|nr:GNAT family N-acetyltransferase [Cyanobium sp. ATX 6A2]MCP9888709.1 GNAT family N-acetyltransferase [Cyanobium sp. ATX 6A2]
MDEAVRYLAWDSQFFDKRVGVFDMRANKSLELALGLAVQKRYELIYIYSPFAIKETLISQYSLLDVGGHITFTKDISHHEVRKVKLASEISEYQRDDPTPELLRIALLSGHLSRFKIDFLLPIGSFERLYETWLAKTLGNRPNAAIYTYQADGRIAGFITAEWNNSKCTIGLLAVLESYQGQGIGARLIKHVEDACMANKVISIEVKTQLSNASARALYLKNFFAEQDRSFLYHAHIVEQSEQ